MDLDGISCVGWSVRSFFEIEVAMPEEMALSPPSM
jgi:hypothetical protein